MKCVAFSIQKLVKFLSRPSFESDNEVILPSIENARLLSVKLIINFLISYPQSDRRRIQTIDFYVKNIDYETVAGRQAVLAVLDGAITQLPAKDVSLSCMLRDLEPLWADTQVSILFFKFIYFWLCWVLVAAHCSTWAFL